MGGDGQTCVDVDECSFLNGGCDQVFIKQNQFKTGFKTAVQKILVNVERSPRILNQNQTLCCIRLSVINIIPLQAKQVER